MNTPTPPGRRVAKPKSKQPAEAATVPAAAAEIPAAAPAPQPDPVPADEPKTDRPRATRDDRRRRRSHKRTAPKAVEAAPKAVEQEFTPAAPAAEIPAAEASAPEAPAADQPSGRQEMGPQTRGLTLLGAKTTVYSDRYTAAILEAFENRHPENDYFVKFNCPEFTSLCPITGQPDFATITINYIPDRKMVESKSLKLYLFGFRNHGAFHEDCVNLIMKDLIKLLSPRYIEVWGKFLPRGGLSIDPYANYGRPTTRWEEFARQRLLMHDLAPEKIDNR